MLLLAIGLCVAMVSPPAATGRATGNAEIGSTGRVLAAFGATRKATGNAAREAPGHPTPALHRRALAAAGTAPMVTFAPLSNPLRGNPVTINVTATAVAGQTITSVQFQDSPAGANRWTTFDCWQASFNATCQATQSTNTYTSNFDSTTLPNGVYDFRALATDSAGNSGTSAIDSDLVVANNATYVGLGSPGTPLSGSVDLTATPEVGGTTPGAVTFLICPTSEDCPANPSRWKTFSTVTTAQLDNNGNPYFTTTLDTTTLSDGTYDLGVNAQDLPAQDAFQGGAVSDLVIDNTPPTVTLDNPGGSLTGTATLSASASGSLSGVASVKFEVSPAGTGNWTTVGVAANPPYSASFDTRQFGDGSYDLRAEAQSGSGVGATSSAVSGVTISNPGAQRFGGLTLTNFAAPASNIKLLGELPGASHETWAIGQTNAPPPPPLRNAYTAQGNGQVVLLNYTDASGWQIVDVLRNGDGSPYPLIPGASLQVSGAMTSSGEAWVTLSETLNSGGHSQAESGVFHRLPGGQFTLDPAATDTLKALLGSPTMVLHETSNGTTYGMLMASTPPAPSPLPTVPSPNGPVPVGVHLEYGQLSGGTWTVQGNTLPASYTAPDSTTTITLPAGAADMTGPGTGWAELDQSSQAGSVDSLILARFDQTGWTFLPATGLDALDQTGPFAVNSQQSVAAGNTVSVKPVALHADGSGLWLSGTVSTTSTTGSVVARYDFARSRVVQAWCATLPRASFQCTSPLDLDHPAAIPDAVFDTAQGQVAEALSRTSNFINVYSDGAWTSTPTPGISGGRTGASAFADPTDGWIVGPNTLAQVSSAAPASPLAKWPEPNRNPLLSVALPPGQSTTDTAGALAVGVLGTAMHYDPVAGWLVDTTPARVQHIELTGVAFANPSLAFAVGQAGAILRWNGSSWSEDPQSVQVTTSTLNAVAFGSDGQGWAVGGFGTILHFDGSAWSREPLDSQDAGANVTSVTVAGADVYAIASGNLVMRQADGTWQRVQSSSLPTPAPPTGSLKLVSGLPDGGLAVAGKSVLMVRQSASDPLAYAPQSFNGIPVALAAFRDGAGTLRAFVSIAPPIATATGLSTDDGGYPPGDGDLLLQSSGGWQDLSRVLPAGSTYFAAGDGVVQPDPVLAVAASPDGSHAWAVGGFAGTHTADGVGTDQILASRSADWFTSAVWRYDAGGSVGSSAITEGNVDLPANPGTVSFAYFSSPLCKLQCAAVQDAQPDVNLTNAAAEISAFAQQPGGPAFALLGGNARGPMDDSAWGTGGGQLDLGRLPSLLAGLSGVPTYAAYGPRDAVPTSSDPPLAWAQAFANAPAPFGPGSRPPGVTPQGSGDATAAVNKYYAFDVSQNGGTLRAIVLDNSAGSLDASAPGQEAWLTAQLSQAQSEGVPVVVFAAEPLNVNDVGAADDADAVAAQLAAAGVLGVFTTSGGGTNAWQNQQDQVVQVPADAPIGAAQVPEYEGATLTYQQPKNNGVLWYDVSVDTTTDKLTVNAVPVISSLALEPKDGLSVARSRTLRFVAIARRPSGTIATTPVDPTFPGYDQYVNIPASTCSSCVGPSYSFTSSNPVVGNFVAPSAPGSTFPAHDPNGKTIPSSKSGLFCAFNGGTTTVSITTGLLTTSLPVTVQSGGYGQPCGTVPGGPSTNVITVPGRVINRTAPNPNEGTPLPPGQGQVQAGLPSTVPPPPLPAAAPVGHIAAKAPKPSPPHRPSPVVPPIPTPVPVQQGQLGVPPVVPPLIPPALTPVPPGGATVSAQATARREEKARKHAQQSAFLIRPAGTSATEWFYPAAGLITVLALLLAAGGLRPGPRPRPALAELWEPVERTRPRR
ncbi:MAG: hypothetical protein JO027_18045 [Solirubrobacterales bacterium]|nr:hypothetical protein [Solirubrobacterales bacterium]